MSSNSEMPEDHDWEMYLLDKLEAALRRFDARILRWLKRKEGGHDMQNTQKPATSRDAVDEAMVLRACNAYDAYHVSDNDEAAAHYPAMHAALLAALAPSRSANEAVPAERSEAPHAGQAVALLERVFSELIAGGCVELETQAAIAKLIDPATFPSEGQGND